MKYNSQVVIVSLMSMCIASCGGGGSGNTTSAENSSGQSVVGCSQHSEFFNSLSGTRVGTVTSFRAPSDPLCEFDVTMTINNDPNFNTCQITAELSYTSQIFNETDTRVCDASNGRRFNVLFGQPIALQDQINLPIQLVFQPIGAQPVQDTNGALISYPVFGGSAIEVDQNFNISIEGQFLTSP